jgi:hypothetical protein
LGSDTGCPLSELGYCPKRTHNFQKHNFTFYTTRPAHTVAHSSKSDHKQPPELYDAQSEQPRNALERLYNIQVFPKPCYAFFSSSVAFHSFNNYLIICPVGSAYESRFSI